MADRVLVIALAGGDIQERDQTFTFSEEQLLSFADHLMTVQRETDARLCERLGREKKIEEVANIIRHQSRPPGLV